MKKESIIFVTVLALLTMLLVAVFTSIASAEIDLSQCSVNNQLEVCNQSLEKAQEVVAVEVVEEKQDKMTLEEFIITLVEMVEERNSEGDVQIITYFEDDSSILVSDKNDMKCVNEVCAPEKEWKK